MSPLRKGYNKELTQGLKVSKVHKGLNINF